MVHQRGSKVCIFCSSKKSLFPSTKVRALSRSFCVRAQICAPARSSFWSAQNVVLKHDLACGLAQNVVLEHDLVLIRARNVMLKHDLFHAAA